MKKLRLALEQLDDMISELEDQLGLQAAAMHEAQKKMAEQVKASRSREAGAVALSQKVATRLDHTIKHVEQIIGKHVEPSVGGQARA